MLLIYYNQFIITNNNIFMLSIKSDKAWLLETMFRMKHCLFSL